jgi:hypothetical protein
MGRLIGPAPTADGKVYPTPLRPDTHSPFNTSPQPAGHDTIRNTNYFKCTQNGPVLCLLPPQERQFTIRPTNQKFSPLLLQGPSSFFTLSALKRWAVADKQKRVSGVAIGV